MRKERVVTLAWWILYCNNGCHFFGALHLFLGTPSGISAFPCPVFTNTSGQGDQPFLVISEYLMLDSCS